MSEEVLLKEHPDGTVCQLDPELKIFVNKRNEICQFCNVGEDNDGNFLIQYWAALESTGASVGIEQMNSDRAEMIADPDGFKSTLAGPLAAYLRKQNEAKEQAEQISELWALQQQQMARERGRSEEPE